MRPHCDQGFSSSHQSEFLQSVKIITIKILLEECSLSLAAFLCKNIPTKLVFKIITKHSNNNGFFFFFF